MNSKSPFAVTRNACKLCNPLGACLVFRGISRSVPLLHGSQGCSTYIRRYMISHFKEPIDIASSNFSEDTAIFGGSSNLLSSINNIESQYRPDFIGIASTCLSETIGDDVEMILKKWRETRKNKNSLPVLVSVSTPSYNGTHIDGFHEAVKATVKTLARGKGEGNHVTILPGMLSPADIRHLKEVMNNFSISALFLPDYSDTLDGPLWNECKRISPGGTTVDEIEKCGSSAYCIEFTVRQDRTAGEVLHDDHGVIRISMPIPIGITLSDRFFSAVEKISGKPTPGKYRSARGRLIDAYVDAHKHASGLRAIIYGEVDLVVSMASFLSECGINPVLCATGEKSGALEKNIEAVTNGTVDPVVIEGADFMDIQDAAEQADADIIIGNSKGYALSRHCGIPLVRIGFPVHDRIGGGRILHIGYEGTTGLFDRIINAHIEFKQNSSSVGYTYM